jgi:cation transport protein ChaC
LVFPDSVFKFVPELKGKVTPPEESQVRLSYERFAEYDKLAAEEHWPADWRMDHDAREANRHEVLAGRLEAPLWIFAYGSLIWDPGIYLNQIRHARVTGWHRAFCMKLEGGRGKPQQPGLMAALDKGGACEGTVCRIPADLVERETEILWMREMFSGSYQPIFVQAETPQGTVDALAFVMDRTNRRYVPGLTADEAARIIARAEGNLGPNFEYLDNLVRHLADLGMADPTMTDLHARALDIRNGKGC